MKKKIICVLCAMMVMSPFGMVVSANNYKDTKYSVPYNGDGADMTTPTRSKLDSSASYVNNNGSKTTAIIVAVGAVDSKGGCRGSHSSYYIVDKGNRKYMPNTVYQNGYRRACLLMGTTSGKAHNLSGVWSPDNCSGY